MSEYEYRVMPNLPEWMPRDVLLKMIETWADHDHGAPAVTISKRVKDEPCGDVHRMQFGMDGETGVILHCARPQGHPGPHADKAEAGTETLSWSRGGSVH